MPRFPHVAEVAGALSDRVFGGKPASGPRPATTYPLHVGDTYLDPPTCARAESQRLADHPRLHCYSPVQGEPALLDAIAAKLARRSGVAPDRDCLQVMSGATGGLAVISTALLQPGDEVLLPSPFWPLIRGIIRSRGAVPVEVPLWTRLQEPGFDPVAALRAAITPRTVALYLNTPHNPTGQVLDAATLDALGALAAAHDLWVLSDEVYEELYYDGQPPPSAFARPSLAARTVATHSVSKAYALAGARVGYTHGPPQAMAAIRGVQTFLTYCAARPMQLGAARALAEGDAWLDRTRSLYATAAALAAGPLGLQPPSAGTFLFFDLRPYLRDGEDAAALRARAADVGVLLTPGEACGEAFSGWTRLCFTAIEPDALQAAVARLGKILRT